MIDILLFYEFNLSLFMAKYDIAGFEKSDNNVYRSDPGSKRKEKGKNKVK